MGVETGFFECGLLVFFPVAAVEGCKVGFKLGGTEGDEVGVAEGEKEGSDVEEKGCDEGWVLGAGVAGGGGGGGGPTLVGKVMFSAR